MHHHDCLLLYLILYAKIVIFFCLLVFSMHLYTPLIDGIAVDWVNEKLYWTEATVGEVLVMDISQRLKRKLIVNHDGSSTRAIAVDPATR